MTTPTTSRARFEEWISADPFGRSVIRNVSDASKSAWPGQYSDITAEVAWLAYQHAEARNREVVEAAFKEGHHNASQGWPANQHQLRETGAEYDWENSHARRALAGLKENEG